MNKFLDKLKSVKPEQALVWIGGALCILAMYLGFSFHGDYLIGLEEYEQEEVSAESDSPDSVPAESEDGAEETEAESDEFSEEEAVPLSAEETVSAGYEAAAEAAAYVMNLQNEYLEDIEIYGTDASQSETMLERIKEIQSELGDLFSDTSFKDVWFSAQDADSVSWSAYAAKDYSGTDIPVIWVCETSGGMVAAYVTAEYNMSENVFSNPSKHVTTVGSSLSSYEESDEADSGSDDESIDEFLDDVQSLIDQAAELGLDTDTSQETETEGE